MVLPFLLLFPASHRSSKAVMQCRDCISQCAAAAHHPGAAPPAAAPAPAVRAPARACLFAGGQRVALLLGDCVAPLHARLAAPSRIPLFDIEIRIDNIAIAKSTQQVAQHLISRLVGGLWVVAFRAFLDLLQRCITVHFHPPLESVLSGISAWLPCGFRAQSGGPSHRGLLCASHAQLCFALAAEAGAQPVGAHHAQQGEDGGDDLGAQGVVI